MSGTGETTADFAGEAREFRIWLGEIRRVQAKCGDVGIGEIVRRLAKAVSLLGLVGPGVSLTEALAAGIEIHADDVREVLYQGLIGAGMASGEATRLVRSEIDERGFRGLLDNVATAYKVLVGTQLSPEAEDPPGEPTAAATPATPKRRSTSRKSTASGPPSA
jgi:hypothetical protein